MAEPPGTRRWTRNAELLVYLVPVGPIATDLYETYVQLLRANGVRAIAGLTRPGGYKAELSPFRSFSWESDGLLRFNFVSTSEAIAACDGEDVHAFNRPVGVIGICHCPSTPSLKDAYELFMQSIDRFPGMLVQKCFAFEHQFEVATVEECSSLSQLVMFPVHHELDNGLSTVALHLQVVLDSIAVTILMSLESSVRAALRQHTTPGATMPGGGSVDLTGDLFLLDTNVEPSRGAAQQQLPGAPPLALLSPRETSGHSMTLPSVISVSVASSSGSYGSDTRTRKRQLARQRKLFGDYAVLLNSVPDALEHYAVALELLRDEERRSNGAAGDLLWLAAALEGYVFCLYLQSEDKFLVEIVEKTSEAVGLYARAGTSELECLLIENLGWYYISVVTQLAATPTKPRAGQETLTESIWIKRLLWDSLERALSLFPELSVQRQVEFMIQASRMLESVGHRRRMAMFLHEAAALLVTRQASRSARARSFQGSHTVARSRIQYEDLQAALLLERMTAVRMGINEQASFQDRAVLGPKRSSSKNHRAPSLKKPDEIWLVLRFHILRQLLTIAKGLNDPFLTAKYSIQLLALLVWSDDLVAKAGAQPQSPSVAALRRKSPTRAALDQPQQPFSSQRTTIGGTSLDRAVLYGKSSVYFTPPSSVETKTKRYFTIAGSPSATMSSAAATLSSTILATPRQQFSAAVNAISTKASPAFASFAHNTSNHGLMASAGSIAEIGAMADSSRSRENSFDRLGNGAGLVQMANGTLLESLNEPVSTVVKPMMTAVLPAWDLHSRDDLVKMQRRLFHILDADCAALRTSEQVKLPAFLRIERLHPVRLRDHKILSKENAVTKYAPSHVDSTKSSATASAFFYSPFEKQKKAKERLNQAADDIDDDGDSAYERSFPVYEQIDLEMRISNPFGVPVKIQMISAWITQDEHEQPITGHHASSTAVECYPNSLKLDAYESQRLISISVRPLKVGSFTVRGCFVKMLNLKTSFALEQPIPLIVVPCLPLATLSLRETEIEQSTASQEPTRCAEEHSVRLSMFDSETKRCSLRICNTGARGSIARCRVEVSVRKKSSTVQPKRDVVFDNLFVDLTKTKSVVAAVSGVLNSDRVRVSYGEACLDTGEESGCALPLERGNSLLLPFELLLHPRIRTERFDSNQDDGNDYDVVWNVVYADDDTSDASSMYRETSVTVTVASLPSLELVALGFTPMCAEQYPLAMVNRSAVTMDHSHCLIIVHVVNPTETVFRVRLQTKYSPLAVSNFNDKSNVCAIEMGRKCARRLAIAVPRSDSIQNHDVDGVAALVNQLVDIKWETLFGTKGVLNVHPQLWPANEIVADACSQLALPSLAFTVSCAEEVTENAKPVSPVMVQSQTLVDTKLLPGFAFFESSLHLWGSDKHRVIKARLYQYYTIQFEVRSSMEQLANIEILLSQEDLAPVGEDLVIISGMLTHHMMFTQEERIKTCEMRCLFLSEGVFRVAIHGKQDNGADDSTDVWCHDPLYVHVSS